MPKESTMSKDFSSATLALLIKEQIGDFEVEDSNDSNLNGLFPLVYEWKPFLRYFWRRSVVAKIHTESGAYVSMVDGNPAYELLVGRLAALLVAEFKTVNRSTGKPGSVVIRFQMPVC